MDKMEWIAPCHFGLESVLKREIQDLGYEIVQVEDGRVTFSGGMSGASGQRLLRNCLKKQKKFRGKITYLRMEDSG